MNRSTTIYTLLAAKKEIDSLRAEIETLRKAVESGAGAGEGGEPTQKTSITITDKEGATEAIFAFDEGKNLVLTMGELNTILMSPTGEFTAAGDAGGYIAMPEPEPEPPASEDTEDKDSIFY